MLSDWMLRLRALFRRSSLENDLDAELQFHLDHQVQAHLARGLDQDQAMRRARLEFGGLEQIKEEYRDALGIGAIDRVRQDLRLSLRSLRATPTVTAIAILSLALGIGATAAIFSIINSLLLRTLPVKDPARLVLLTDTPTHARSWSYPIWLEIHRRQYLFQDSAAWSFTRFDLSAGGQTQFVDGLWVSGSFFETLGVTASLGRTLSARALMAPTSQSSASCRANSSASKSAEHSKWQCRWRTNRSVEARTVISMRSAQVS